VSTTQASDRLEHLETLLAADEANPHLLAECASAALDAARPLRAQAHLDRLRSVADSTPATENLRGLVALKRGRYAAAAEIFSALLPTAPADSALRFNLASALTLQAQHEQALGVLEGGPISSGDAAALRIRLLHQLGRLDEILAEAASLAEAFPDHRGLLGALASAAFDAEALERAQAFALRAQGHHEGHAALGLIALHEGRQADAAKEFDTALTLYPGSGRALLGQAAVLMLQKNLVEAADVVRRVAETYGTHLGSWLTLGWLQLLQGDRVSARATFEKALDIDDTFAEIHGSLAVIEVLEGRLERAERSITVANRLDPEGFSAALAKALVTEAKGDPAQASAIMQRALATPLEPGGESLSAYMARLTLG
jgi:tetratricopeptide (TPR) repeat protein